MEVVFPMHIFVPLYTVKCLFPDHALLTGLDNVGKQVVWAPLPVSAVRGCLFGPISKSPYV